MLVPSGSGGSGGSAVGGGGDGDGGFIHQGGGLGEVPGMKTTALHRTVQLSPRGIRVPLQREQSPRGR